jgi:hypothetical protein
MLRDVKTIGMDCRMASCRASAQRPLGLRLLGLHPVMLVEQPLLIGGLALHLLGLQVEVHEDRHLGLQDEGVHRLEDHVDGAGRVGLEDVRLVAEDRRQEDDRRVLGPLARTDQGGGLVAVHARHVQVEQDEGEFLGQQPAQRILARAGDHQLMAQLLQRLDGGEGVALVVVDDEDPRRQRGLEVGRRHRLRPPGSRQRAGG